MPQATACLNHLTAPHLYSPLIVRPRSNQAHWRVVLNYSLLCPCSDPDKWISANLSYIYQCILIIAESRRERNRPKGSRAQAWKISLKRPDQHECRVNRVIWIMQALKMEISVKRQRWVALYPISPCQGSVTEPRSFCVFYPQTMDLQMEIIFVPPPFNPVSVTSLSNGRGLLPRLFHYHYYYYIWKGTNSPWHMHGWVVG